jgi:hypothetical protein
MSKCSLTALSDQFFQKPATSSAFFLQLRRKCKRTFNGFNEHFFVKIIDCLKENKYPEKSKNRIKINLEPYRISG